MNGQILSGTCIAVDFWKIKGQQQNYTHFLTHVHGDHIVGLTSSWSRSIYCSSFSAQILEDHYAISKCWLKILPLNQSTLVQMPHSGESFCVTAFDANHCPGAVMLYFEGKFGNILHTGDFRFSSEMMTENLRNLCGKVDVVYIDNTFCSPSCIFPSRENCLEQIIAIIKQHPDSHVIVGMRKLGKESMLAKIGVALNETVYISSERYSISQHLFDCNVFSVLLKGDEGRIRAVPFQSVSRGVLYKLNQKRPTIAILPTAIFTGLPCKPFSRDPYIHVVPYSDHSSFPELVTFVKYLQPKTIIPIVQDSRGPFGTDISDRSDMLRLKSYADSFSIDSNSLCSSPLDSNSNNVKSVIDLNSFDAFLSSSSSEHYYITTKGYSEKSISSENNNDRGDIPMSVLKRKKSLSAYPAKRKKMFAKGVVFQNDSAELSDIKEVNQDKNCDVTSSTPDFEVTDTTFHKQTALLTEISMKPEHSLSCSSRLIHENIPLTLSIENNPKNFVDDKLSEKSISETKSSEPEIEESSDFVPDNQHPAEEVGICSVDNDNCVSDNHGNSLLNSDSCSKVAEESHCRESLQCQNEERMPVAICGSEKLPTACAEEMLERDISEVNHLSTETLTDNGHTEMRESSFDSIISAPQMSLDNKDVSNSEYRNCEKRNPEVQNSEVKDSELEDSFKRVISSVGERDHHRMIDTDKKILENSCLEVNSKKRKDLSESEASKCSSSRPLSCFSRNGEGIPSLNDLQELYCKGKEESFASGLDLKRAQGLRNKATSKIDFYSELQISLLKNKNVYHKALTRLL